MFTTELLQRIFLTVSLSLFIQLLLIGHSNEIGAATATTTISQNEGKPLLSTNGSTTTTATKTFKTNDQIFLGQQLSKLTAGESDHDDDDGADDERDDEILVNSPNSRSLHFGSSKTSYIFPPRRLSTSSLYQRHEEKPKTLNFDMDSNSAYINAKPLSFSTTNVGTKKAVIRNQDVEYLPLNSRRKGHEAGLGDGAAEIKYECLFSTSKNCGQEDSGSNIRNTQWKSVNSYSNKNPFVSDGNSASGGGGGAAVDAFSSIPFTVIGNPSNRKDQRNANSSPAPSSEMSVPHPRHPTPSPAWVKLEPVLPNSYDPFSVSNLKRNGLSSSNNDKNSPTSKFSNRLGQPEELNPETFAKRYGYQPNSSIDKYNGARLPTWLEELNYQQGTSPILDEIREEESRRWVKLDPVSVAGVTISKWVPKGTSPSQLPSTSNWPIRGNVANLGASSKPSSSNDWWDRIDTEPSLPPKGHSSFQQQQQQQRPSHFGWSSETANNGNAGWGIRYPPQYQPQTSPNKKRPGLSDAWNDIIYPEGPASATASWEADKNLHAKFPSSSSISSSSSWSTHPNKRPIASWTAPGANLNNIRVESSYNPHRRYGTSGSYYRPGIGRPNSYPDPSSSRDDPRWVLVSSTSNIENVESNSNHNNNNNRRQYYGSERYSPSHEFPYEYYGQTHRHSKTLDASGNPTEEDTTAIDPILVEQNESSYTFKPLSQDELFKRTNDTLHTLKPMLTHHSTEPTSSNPDGLIGLELLDSDLEKMPTGSIEDNGDQDDLLVSSLEDIGDGRGNSGKPKKLVQKKQILVAGGALPPKKGFLAGLNPIYTAVGAGMIPATLAAVLPLALGRRRRKRSAASSQEEIFLIDEPSLVSATNFENTKITSDKNPRLSIPSLRTKKKDKLNYMSSKMGKPTKFKYLIKNFNNSKLGTF